MQRKYYYKKTSDSASLGNYLVVRHKNGLSSLYAHMNFVAVRRAQTVSLSERLGSVGLTGFTTGPHLHLPVYLNAGVINPQLILRPS